MPGTRIFCDQIIPVPDWNRDYVTVKSKLESKSPLPTLASFDLLNPLDNSGHGYTVTPRGGQIRDWGLHYDNGAVPSLTDFVQPGKGAVSFVTAFNLSRLDRYINVFSSREAGAGFNFYYSGGFYLSYIYPGGGTGTIATGEVSAPEAGKWYVAAGVFDAANKIASVRISELGLRYGSIGGSFPANTVLDAALSIGGGPDGSTTSSMAGDIAFVAAYDGAFTAEQRDAMIPVGQEVLQKRGLI
ncbi:LamG-like jellyroll fold domain-containing protein [Klebsiella michiganensis]|uniref:LamG-like jellyroll fold domain-containing protein n=1 Tax=Klebsiella michiganensis TaxID=1134687 RepID=UPI000C9B6CD2|nr:LamG-like jellyroll fold domain-containing protein [Klebsiella michiganensis]